MTIILQIIRVTKMKVAATNIAINRIFCKSIYKLKIKMKIKMKTKMKMKIKLKMGMGRAFIHCVHLMKLSPVKFSMKRNRMRERNRERERKAKTKTKELNVGTAFLKLKNPVETLRVQKQSRKN